MNTINEKTLKVLTGTRSNAVKDFIRTASRLRGNIALREQFKIKKNDSYVFVEINEEQLSHTILRSAHYLVQIVTRLNFFAEKEGLPNVLALKGDESLSEIVSIVREFSLVCFCVQENYNQYYGIKKYCLSIINISTNSIN